VEKGRKKVRMRRGGAKLRGRELYEKGKLKEGCGSNWYKI